MEEKKSIWHKPTEEPREDEEILFLWGGEIAKHHSVGYYNQSTKRLNTPSLLFTMDDIERWAYVEDITQL